MNIFQKWLYAIQSSDNDQFIKTIDSKNQEINNLKDENKRLVDSNTVCGNEVEKLNDQITKLNEQINIIKQEEELEKYWNNKRPAKSGWNYNGRPAPNNTAMINLDVKQFYVSDYNIPTVSGSTIKDKMFAAMRWVKNNITYTPDTNQFKIPEMWLFPFETMKLGKGDCEDMNILVANILLASGVPYWRIRVVAGSVTGGGGHCWCTVLCDDNIWYVADTAYWPEQAFKGLKWKDTENYINIWFSWNTKYAYTNDEMDR